MTVASPVSTRASEVQSAIRKIRTFGRNARAVCKLFIALLVIAVPLAILSILAAHPGVNGIKIGLGTGLGTYTVTADQISTPAFRAWAGLVVVVVVGVALASLQRLYRLFGNLAGGEIYTADNVRLLRQVGLLSLLMAVLGIVIPVGSAALAAVGVIDAPESAKGQLLFGSNSFGSFIGAGLVLLASWIMDVGLYTKDHADALERDADLVI